MTYDSAIDRGADGPLRLHGHGPAEAVREQAPGRAFAR